MKSKKTLNLILACFLLMIASCTSNRSPQPTRPITPFEVQGMLNNDFAIIVDVREPSERAERIEKARPLPMSSIESNAPELQSLLKDVAKDKTLVFCCSNNAQKAAEKIASQGLKTAYFENLEDWRKAGLPLTKAQ